MTPDPEEMRKLHAVAQEDLDKALRAAFDHGAASVQCARCNAPAPPFFCCALCAEIFGHFLPESEE